MAALATKSPLPLLTDIEESDPGVRYILQHAPHDIQHTASRLALRYMCRDKSPRILETFDALDFLLKVYGPTGRTSFTLRDIQTVMHHPIAKSTISTHLRDLVACDLIQICGRQEAYHYRRPNRQGGEDDLRPFVFAIDWERINRIGAKVYVGMTRQLALPPPPRPAPDPQGQPGISLWDAPLADTVQPGRQELFAAPNSSGPTVQADQAVLFGQRDSSEGRGARLYGDPNSSGATVQPAVSELFATPHDIDGTVQPARDELFDAIDSSETESARLYGSPNSPGKTGPEPFGPANMRKKESRKIEGRGEKQGLALQGPPALTPDMILHAIRNEVRAALQEERTTTKEAPHLPEPKRHVPPAPAGEGAIEAGPLELWADITGGAPAPKDTIIIRELVRQVEALQPGFGAYWVARVMAVALCSASGKSLQLAYLQPILNRLKTSGFNSRVLVQPRAEREGEEPPAPAEAPASPEPSGERPAELRDQPAVAAWYTAIAASRAPRKKGSGEPSLSRELAEQVARTVGALPADLERWRSTLDNWMASGYAATNVHGQLDRYRNETLALNEYREHLAATPPPNPTRLALEDVPEAAQLDARRRARARCVADFADAAPLHLDIEIWLAKRLATGGTESVLVATMQRALALLQQHHPDETTLHKVIVPNLADALLEGARGEVVLAALVQRHYQRGTKR